MKAAPSDSASYIDQMIATERENQKPGYATRIEELEKERKSAVLLDKVIHGGNIEGFQKINSMKLEDRAKNVRKTVRDENYTGYDKTGPKQISNKKDDYVCNSRLKQEDIEKLENIIKKYNSHHKDSFSGSDFEKIKLLLDTAQSICVTNAKFESTSADGKEKLNHFDQDFQPANIVLNNANLQEHNKPNK